MQQVARTRLGMCWMKWRVARERRRRMMHATRRMWTWWRGYTHRRRHIQQTLKRYCATQEAQADTLDVAAPVASWASVMLLVLQRPASPPSEGPLPLLGRRLRDVFLLRRRFVQWHRYFLTRQRHWYILRRRYTSEIVPQTARYARLITAMASKQALFTIRRSLRHWQTAMRQQRDAIRSLLVRHTGRQVLQAWYRRFRVVKMQRLLQMPPPPPLPLVQPQRRGGSGGAAVAVVAGSATSSLSRRGGDGSTSRRRIDTSQATQTTTIAPLATRQQQLLQLDTTYASSAYSGSGGGGVSRVEVIVDAKPSRASTTKAPLPSKPQPSQPQPTETQQPTQVQSTRRRSWTSQVSSVSASSLQLSSLSATTAVQHSDAEDEDDDVAAVEVSPTAQRYIGRRAVAVDGEGSAPPPPPPPPSLPLPLPPRRSSAAAIAALLASPATDGDEDDDGGGPVTAAVADVADNADGVARALHFSRDDARSGSASASASASGRLAIRARLKPMTRHDESTLTQPPLEATAPLVDTTATTTRLHVSATLDRYLRTKRSPLSAPRWATTTTTTVETSEQRLQRLRLEREHREALRQQQQQPQLQLQQSETGATAEDAAAAEGADPSSSIRIRRLLIRGSAAEALLCSAHTTDRRHHHHQRRSSSSEDGSGGSVGSDDSLNQSTLTDVDVSFDEVSAAVDTTRPCAYHVHRAAQADARRMRQEGERGYLQQFDHALALAQVYRQPSSSSPSKRPQSQRARAKVATSKAAGSSVPAAVKVPPPPSQQPSRGIRSG